MGSRLSVSLGLLDLDLRSGQLMLDSAEGKLEFFDRMKDIIPLHKTRSKRINRLNVD